MNKEKLVEAWEWEFKYWIPIFGSEPIRLVYSKDNSEPYEMDRRLIFGLENGQFAVVKERGCSCYEPSEAVIDLLPTLEKAIEVFEQAGEYEEPNKWKLLK